MVHGPNFMVHLVPKECATSFRGGLGTAACLTRPCSQEGTCTWSQFSWHRCPRVAPAIQTRPLCPFQSKKEPQTIRNSASFHKQNPMILRKKGRRAKRFFSRGRRFKSCRGNALQECPEDTDPQSCPYNPQFCPRLHLAVWYVHGP